MPSWLKLDTFEKFRDTLILIPTLHIIACFLYLFFFYYSFGHGLIYFASPTEVFSVSLSEIAPLYLTGGFGMLVGLWSHETDEEIEERYSPRSQKFLKKVKGWQYKSFFIIPAIFGFLGLTASIWFGYIFWYDLAIPLIVGLAYFAGYIGAQKGLSLPSLCVLFFAGSTVIWVSANGLSDGQRAAKIEYASFANNPTCKDYIVLKDVSGDFLAVAENNDRVVLNRDCQQKFLLINGDEQDFFNDPQPREAISNILSSFL